MSEATPREYTFQTLSLGLSEGFEVALTEEMMRGFEAISGDHSPIHTDTHFARGRGYPECVVYGMLTASFYSTLVGMYLPGKHGLLLELDSSFRKPVFVGDRLTVRGEVVFVSEAARLIEVKADMRNQDGKSISKAIIKAGVYDT